MGECTAGGTKFQPINVRQSVQCAARSYVYDTYLLLDLPVVGSFGVVTHLNKKSIVKKIFAQHSDHDATISQRQAARKSSESDQNPSRGVDDRRTSFVIAVSHSSTTTAVVVDRKAYESSL